ncbi:MAG: hypothetical protein C0436_00095 [Alphaproteobacteria bacterium]|nr:hypothetical protein [Alphaproteobacteria bacterium]
MKYNKNLAGIQITNELINRASSASARLAHDTILASTVVVRTAPGGGGTLLALTTDYTLGGQDTRLSTEARATVNTTLAVVNGAYQNTNLYVSYKTVGDYTEAEDAIQRFSSDTIGNFALLSNGLKLYGGAGIIESGSNSNGSYVKFSDGTMECWGTYTVIFSNTVTAGAIITYPQPFISPPSFNHNANDHQSGVGYLLPASSVNPTSTTATPILVLREGQIITATKTGSWRAIGRWK